MADDILGKLGEAVVLLRADGSKLSEDMKKEKEKLEQYLDDLGGKFKSAGTALAIGLTAPMIAMGAAAVAAGVKVDEALDTIRARTGATGDALTGLSQDFTEVFSQVPDDAQTVAESLSLIYQRTGQTGKGLQDLTKQLLDLSRLTGTEVTANVDAATKSFAAWQIETTKQKDALDFVYKVAQQTGASVTDLMTNVTQSQGVFAQFNYTFEESVALLGQWNKAGIEASDVTAALKKATVTFAEAGIPAREGLEKTLNLIKELGPGTKATNLAMEVFGNKAGPQLATALHQGRIGIDQLMATVKGSKDTIADATRDTEGFSEGLARLGNRATIALEPLGTKLIALGEKALPYFEKLIGLVGTAVDWFTKLPGPVQATGLALAGIAAAAGPTLIALGGMISGYKELVLVLKTAEIAQIGFAKGLPGIAANLSAIGRYAGIAGLALASMWAGAKVAEIHTKHLDNLKNSAMDLAKADELIAAKEKELAAAIENTNDKLAYKLRAELNALKSGRDLAKQNEDTKNGVVELTDEQVKANAAQFKAGQEADKTKKELEKLLSQINKNEKGTETYADKVKKLAEAFGKDVVQNGVLYADALKKAGGVTKLTTEEVERFADALDDAYVKMKLLGLTSGPEFQKVQDAWLDTQKALFNSKVHSTGAIANLLTGGINPKELGKMAAQDIVEGAASFVRSKTSKYPLADILGIGPSANLGTPPGTFDIFKRNLKDAFTGKDGFVSSIGPAVAQSILGALQGGGNVGKSIGATVGGMAGNMVASSLVKSLGSGAIGKVLGGLAGSFLGPLGSLAGSALGGLVSKLFGGKGEGRKMVEEFAHATFGGFDQLREKLLVLGEDGERLWKRLTSVKGSKTEAEAAIRAITNALGDYDAKQKQIIQDELDARDRLQSAIEKYGFTIDELGPKWRQQELDKQAEELILDYTALTASGIDVDTVIRRMGDSINEFIHLALKTGSEVPEAMRPMLQRMTEMGLLTDANGDKIEDLEGSGITFSMTLSQGFKTVTDKLTELIQTITGKLNPALLNIPSPTVTVGVQYEYDDSGFNRRRRVTDGGSGEYDAASNPDGHPELDKGGVANWGAGTLAVLHNKEAIMPVEPLMRMIADSAGDNLTPEGLVEAMMAAGLGRPNVNVDANFTGSLGNDMYAFASFLIPILNRVWQDNGTLRNQSSNILES